MERIQKQRDHQMQLKNKVKPVIKKKKSPDKNIQELYQRKWKQVIKNKKHFQEHMRKII